MYYLTYLKVNKIVSMVMWKMASQNLSLVALNVMSDTMQ